MSEVVIVAAARTPVGSFNGGLSGLAPQELGRTVLEEARRWHADLVVVGKSARSASGDPYVGAVTRHVLEFCEQPVLVVPPPPGGRRG